MNPHDVEPELLKIHAELATFLNQESNEWILKYISNSECELGFGNLVRAILNNGAGLTQDQYARLDAIGEAMEMDSQLWEPLESRAK